MVDLQNTIHRRGFLGSIAKGAAVVGLGSLATPFTLESKPVNPPMKSDDSAFDAWLGKINGKHKQVFDAPNWNSGFPLAWARVILMSYGDAGIPTGDVSVVVILRHEAIPLAMENRLWEKYKLGEFFKINDPKTNAPSVRNGFWQPKEGELPLPGMSIDQLQKDGVMFGVCNVALTVLSEKIGKPMNLDGAEVKKDWIAGLLPGIQIVPSGVYAVNRVQEQGCAYCFAGG
jgi:intracellular sulfur oxidation DsrE/DsrF family protein